MRARLLLTLVLLVGTSAIASQGVEPEKLRALGAESAAVREQAAADLEANEALLPADVETALRVAGPRAAPLLFRIAAARGMSSLVPAMASAAAAPDAVAAEAAIRALVLLGADGVDAGAKALSGDAVPDGAARLRHLRALAAQRKIEKAVLSRWRRKGGSYDGRFVAALADLGPEVQPVLLAMLLDIPLEDQFVLVDPTGDADADTALRKDAAQRLASSPRRGYRTFEPLSGGIDGEDLFGLAAQALKDVADLAVIGDVLEITGAELRNAVANSGFQARRWEQSFLEGIEIIQAAHGQTRWLDLRARKAAGDVRRWRRTVLGSSPTESDEFAQGWQFYAVAVSEHAGLLHQLGRFDEAAATYETAVEIRMKLTGRLPSIDEYNRACSLARGGRKDEALTALARAIDPDPKLTTGIEDLTREWVTEDGDLASLHDDPRFEAIIRKRFGGN